MSAALISLEQRLSELNLELPALSKPGGSYTSVNVRGNQAFVAIQFPIVSGQHLYKGVLGKELNTEDGYRSMQLCALNVIAHIHHKVGFERVEGLNQIEAYYRSDPDWDDAPRVVDGASELFVHVLGEKGIHARSIFGVHDLPRHFATGLSASFTLR